MNRHLILIALAPALFVAGRADAAIQFFTTLGTWQAAIGTTNAIEDFHGFAADTPFTIGSGPVSLAGGMSIVEFGLSGNNSPRNKVDVLPYDFSTQSPNGSTFANMNLNPTGHSVRIDFQNAIRAWGADFAEAHGGAYLTLAPQGASGELASMVIPTDTTFFGFQATSGEAIVSLILRGDSGPTGEEDLGMDNVRLAFVPEPGVGLLMTLFYVPAFVRVRSTRKLPRRLAA